MKPTLQERLASEARLRLASEMMKPEDDGDTFGVLDAIILHTIEQTIKEGCEVVEGMKREDKECLCAHGGGCGCEIRDYNQACRDISKELVSMLKSEDGTNR